MSRSTGRHAKIQILLERLEELESRKVPCNDAPIIAVAREAIVDELSRLAREDWLAVYRRGNSLDAIHLAG